MLGRVSNLVRGKKRKEGPDGIPVIFEEGKGVTVMDMAMQQKLSRGVKYNLKVVIKGPRKAGKTQLLRRLLGKKFEPAYYPSPQMQAATVHWCSRKLEGKGGGSEPVKLEVWDMVDEGFRTPAMLERDQAMGMTFPIADSTTIDVYRGAHAVILLLDATSDESIDYLRKQIQKVPRNVLILVCRNKCDLEDEIVVTEADIEAVLKDRRASTTQFMADAARGAKVDDLYSIPPAQLALSCLNCYGLQQLYTYINIPYQFLHAQTLEAQLQATWQTISDFTTEMADLARKQDYQDYLLWLHKDKEEPPPAQGPRTPPPEPVVSAPPLPLAHHEVKAAPPVMKDSFSMSVIDDKFFEDTANAPSDGEAADTDDDDFLTAAELAQREHERKQGNGKRSAPRKPAKRKEEEEEVVVARSATPPSPAVHRPPGGGLELDHAESQAKRAEAAVQRRKAEMEEVQRLEDEEREAKRAAEERAAEAEQMKEEEERKQAEADARERAEKLQRAMELERKADEERMLQEAKRREEELTRAAKLDNAVDLGGLDDSFFDDDGEDGEEELPEADDDEAPSPQPADYPALGLAPPPVSPPKPSDMDTQHSIPDELKATLAAVMERMQQELPDPDPVKERKEKKEKRSHRHRHHHDDESGAPKKERKEKKEKKEKKSKSTDASDHPERRHRKEKRRQVESDG